MNISKFTQKSLDAVQNTEKLAYEYGNQQIDQEHLLYSLLTVEDSLIFKLITKMGISGDQFRDEVQQAIGKLPKVSGGQVYFSNDANKVLVNAEDEAKASADAAPSAKGKAAAKKEARSRNCSVSTALRKRAFCRRFRQCAATSVLSAIIRRQRMTL